MRVHVLHRHVQDTVVILEEGNLPHPRCPPVRSTAPQEGAQWAPSGDRALGTPWVGVVALLQHHHGVLDVPVHEVHLHRRPCH